MKKIVSILLSVLMLISVIAPSASAFNVSTDLEKNIPIIHLRGDGESIYDADGNQVFPTGYDLGKLPETAKDVIFPYFFNALVFDQWDEYYDAFENAVKPIFEKAILDKNGDPINGSDVSASRRASNDSRSKNNYIRSDGTYNLMSYQFYYDWRRDPFEIADKLHAFIEQIKITTGAQKVSLSCNCLGGSFILAYLVKYGHDDIHGVMFDATVANGCEIASDLFSGKAVVDGKAIERYLDDTGLLSSIAGISSNVTDFIETSLKLFNETGAINLISTPINELYQMLYSELTSRMVINSFGTFPGYWTAVKSEDYYVARELIFGKEGSEKFNEYKGLIAKIDNYHDKVSSRIPEIIQELRDDGVNVGIISKYGFQIMPLIESKDKISDNFVCLDSASFGATCMNINKTFSDDYIAKQAAEGLDKYISNDKQVDASTCILRDSTWFIKGMDHNNWDSLSLELPRYICLSKEQFTVDSLPDVFPQFMVYNTETDEVLPMTDDNCNISNWDNGEDEKSKEISIAKIFIKWLKQLFEILLDLFQSKQG